MYKVLKSKELEIRNSPLDRLAGLFTKLLFCAKGVCDYAPIIGSATTGLIIADSILEAKGKRGIFIPYLAEIILPDSPEDKIIKERKEHFKNMNKLDNFHKLLLEDKSNIELLKDSNLFSKEDINIMLNGFKDEEDIIINQKDEIMSKIKENFDRRDKK